jgi:two-component system, chemotaxis family, chemotaxis protein CheY
MPKILVVEDESDVRTLISLILQSAGHTVIEAHNGLDALEQFNAGHFDMVITDMNMPRMDGLELIKALRRQQADLYIMLITGYGTTDTEKRAGELGVNEYIPKPFDIEALRERVDRHFHRSA